MYGVVSEEVLENGGLSLFWTVITCKMEDADWSTSVSTDQ